MAEQADTVSGPAQADAAARALEVERGGAPLFGRVLLGAVTVEHLASNLEALQVRLGAEDRNRQDGLVEEPAAYWRRRSGLAWT